MVEIFTRQSIINTVLCHVKWKCYKNSKKGEISLEKVGLGRAPEGRNHLTGKRNRQPRCASSTDQKQVGKSLIYFIGAIICAGDRRRKRYISCASLCDTVF